jgi:hypothetical protein
MTVIGMGESDANIFLPIDRGERRIQLFILQGRKSLAFIPNYPDKKRKGERDV